MTFLRAFVLLAALFASANSSAVTFPIGSWLGPPSNQNSLNHWQTFADAGFNIAGPNRLYTADDHLKAIAFCERLGMSYLVRDDRIRPGVARRDHWEDIVKEVIDTYRDEDAVVGYYIEDEPGTSVFNIAKAISDVVKAEDPKAFPYINLLPSYASTTQWQAESYQDYVSQFVDVFHPEVLSFDHYTVIRRTTDYFFNLDVIWRAAAKSGATPWFILQGAGWGGRSAPTLAELTWQVSTGLAYGMKGFFYYFYWPPPGHSTHKVGIVTESGVPTPTYFQIQAVNATLAELGRFLLPLRLVQVFHTQPVPVGGQMVPSSFPLRVDLNDVLLSEFTSDDGCSWYLVVNRDRDNAKEFSFENEEELTFVSPVKLQLPRGSYQNWEFALGPGEAALFRKSVCNL